MHSSIFILLAVGCLFLDCALGTVLCLLSLVADNVAGVRGLVSQRLAASSVLVCLVLGLLSLSRHCVGHAASSLVDLVTSSAGGVLGLVYVALVRHGDEEFEEGSAIGNKGYFGGKKRM
eukprot:GDKK01019825.1.p1 GENE.GDKK01019825.1~~GDKK01019825.1.p1  ORF type:complete len:119 (-),score=11.60 GDKK01019825.1:27-383(-)